MKWIAAISLLFFSLNIFAAKPENLPGYLLKNQINYTSNGVGMKLNTEFVLDRDSRDWTTVGEVDNKILVKGRIAKVEGETVSVEYQVIDTSGKKHKVISEPSINTMLDSGAAVKQSSDVSSLGISTKVSEIYYYNE